jgi:hypothetical protein
MHAEPISMPSIVAVLIVSSLKAPFAGTACCFSEFAAQHFVTQA